MASQRTFHFRRFTRRTAAAALIVGICLALSGGCKQLSRMEDNQLELQRMMEADAKQIVGGLARVEENQSTLHGAIDQVQAEAKKGTAGVASLEQGQARLQTAIKDTQAVTRQSVQDVATVREEQKAFRAALAEALQAGKDDWSAQIGKIAGGQRQLADRITAVQGSIDTVASRTEGLQQNMSALRETVQSGTENMANVIDIVGQKQLKFEEKILIDIRAIAGVVNAIEQKQAMLQSQVGDVQSNTQAMRDSMIAVLKQLRSELSRISSELGSATGTEEGGSAAEVKQ